MRRFEAAHWLRTQVNVLEAISTAFDDEARLAGTTARPVMPGLVIRGATDDMQLGGSVPARYFRGETAPEGAFGFRILDAIGSVVNEAREGLGLATLGRQRIYSKVLPVLKEEAGGAEDAAHATLSDVDQRCRHASRSSRDRRRINRWCC